MRRASPLELRGSNGGGGPYLYGVLIQEGRAAWRRREVFAPGAVEWPSGGVGILTRHHAAPVARAVPTREADGRITVKARATDAIRAAVEAGRRFMSVEFHAIRERRTGGGIREILRAFVPDVALVADPEYDTTAAEVRRRRRWRMRSRMPRFRAVDCRCGPEDCNSALVEEIDLSAEVLGYLDDYSKPLGRATARETREGIETVIEIATDEVSYASDLVVLVEAGVSPIVRPYPDPELSRTRKEGRTLVYESLVPAAWIATYTDQRGGFEAATLAEAEENRRGLERVQPSRPLEAILERPAESSRRRIWL